MAPEDMRDDLIDNEPVNCTDDSSVEEKTWGWFVFTLRRLNLWVLWLISSKRWFVLFAGFCPSGGIPSEHFAITTNGSASVSVPTVKHSGEI